MIVVMKRMHAYSLCSLLLLACSHGQGDGSMLGANEKEILKRKNSDVTVSNVTVSTMTVSTISISPEEKVNSDLPTQGSGADGAGDEKNGRGPSLRTHGSNEAVREEHSPQRTPPGSPTDDKRQPVKDAGISKQDGKAEEEPPTSPEPGSKRKREREDTKQMNTPSKKAKEKPADKK